MFQLPDVLEVIPRGLFENWPLVLRVAEKGMGKLQRFPTLLQQLHKGDEATVFKPAPRSAKCDSFGHLATPGKRLFYIQRTIVPSYAELYF